MFKQTLLQKILLYSFAFSCILAQQCDSDTKSCDAGQEKSCGCSISRGDKSKYTDKLKTDVDEDLENEPLHENTMQAERTNQMVFIDGGTYYMGTNKPIFVADGEEPERLVKINSFYLDKFEVSNNEFDIFVKDTKYKTEVISLIVIHLNLKRISIHK